MEFFASFDRRKYIGYGYSRISNEIDGDIARAIEFFAARSLNEKERLTAEMSAAQAGVLATYGERMASLAVRRGDRSLLISGLVALAIAYGTSDDYREVLRVVPLHYRSAQLLGADPNQVFREASASVPAASQAPLLGQLARPPEDRGIDVMGYEEGADADGFVYVRRG